MKSLHHRTISLLTFLAVLAVVSVGCTRQNGQAPAPPPQQEESAPAATNRIDIPATVRKNLGITLVKVERRKVESTIRVPGAFELQPLARHEYRLSLPGTVQLAVDQYDRVEPGDLLFRFRSPQWPEIQHEIIVGEQDIESALADIDVAKARTDEAERRLAILRDRIASLTAADMRSADLEAQVAEMEASLPRLRAELRLAETRLANGQRTREHALHRASAASGIAEDALAAEVQHQGRTELAYRTIDWIEVRATEPGVVEALALTDGSFAEAPSLVLSTVDPTKVRFRAMALQSDLARLGVTPEGRIVPPSTPGIPLGDSVDASVSVGFEANPEQRTVTLLATAAESRAWMRPGISAFLEVVAETSGGPALAIPRAAIVRDGLTHVFFRRDPQDPNKAIRVEADMGVDDGRWVAINSGLMFGDEVILNGAYELKLASEQSGRTQRGGHFHADGTFHSEDE
ncbi:efflux RND transporter periplasmic adaptor subunit [Nodularia spumigena]|uniref:efflux RND transporter periplasmic adaptor subunit n=1 Tax=Nodularia spumigena TaxID=70799 RepID=UPI002B2022C1|nr:hypothetical protein [Nodularia spumigena]MEA5615122.1 hypothetical protein [Nodularia spumigena UHCC 0040]